MQVVSPNQSSDKDLSYYLNLPHNYPKQSKTSRNYSQSKETLNISDENNSQLSFKELRTPKDYSKSANRFINSVSAAPLKHSSFINQQQRGKSKEYEALKVKENKLESSSKKHQGDFSISAYNSPPTSQIKSSHLMKKSAEKEKASTEHLVNIKVESFLTSSQKSLLESSMKEKNKIRSPILFEKRDSKRNLMNDEDYSTTDRTIGMYHENQDISSYQTSLSKQDRPKKTPEKNQIKTSRIYSPWPPRKVNQEQGETNQGILSRSNSLRNTPSVNEEHEYTAKTSRSKRRDYENFKQQPNQRSSEDYKELEENHRRETQAIKDMKGEKDEVDLMELIKSLEKELEMKELEAMELKEEKLRRELNNKKMIIEIEEIKEKTCQNEERATELKAKVNEQEKEIQNLKVKI